MTRNSQGIVVSLICSALISVTAAAHYAKAVRHAGAPSSNELHSDASQQVTFTRDIAPIIFRSCAPCHRPGEAAPFSLLTYADAKSHARLIEDVSRRRIMPPWLPAADDPKFADDLRLSDTDIARLRDWAES